HVGPPCTERGGAGGGASTSSPGDDGRARSGQRRAERSRRQPGANVGQELGAIRLVEPVVERGGEQLVRSGCECGTEERGTAGAEGRVLVGDADREQRARMLRRDLLVGP